jgi:TatD DNase family protein
VTPLVDSHCHLNFEPLNTGLDDVLLRARDNGITHMLCVSVALETFPEIRQLSHRNENIYASVGVHPNEKEGHEPSVKDLVDLAKDERVVAIGETGLDYYRNKGEMGWQQERFRNHIRAAKQSGKPLIIHSREASVDTIRIMRDEGAAEPGGVMHCFTESREVARQALDLNFYISFSGIVTFRNAEALREVARLIPSDRLLIETDAPYLAPAPYRGKTNEPAYVRHVAECLANIRNVHTESIGEITTRNFFTLFKHAGH